jgi:hypothetical protein
VGQNFGQVGDPIKGSKFFRDYCANCSEPMRVTGPRVGEENYCWDCDGHERPTLGASMSPGQYAKGCEIHGWNY